MRTVTKKNKTKKLFNLNKHSASIRYHKSTKNNKYRIKGGLFSSKTNANNVTQSKKINCSPKPNNEINNFSCYTNRSLIKLRDMWNARHPDSKIITSSPKEIHKML